ncbi:MAG: dockerin type I domain-containing protein, partial [Oscillospiraceae bacterium]|nr:dockerin type I domain-containing protein [Oscillospiraceae bacterium]
MKKLLSILISCVLIFIPLAARVSAAGEETYGYIHYTVYIFDEIYEFENEKDYKDFLKEIGRDDGLFDDPFGDYQDDGPEIMPGDVDGDGEITAADARFVLRYCAKLEILTDIQMIAADVNGDGGVTAADARKILRIAAKLDGRQEDENARQLTGQYNAYLQNASNAGLIPENIHRYLEEYLTYGDFIDFLLNFAQIKCGINAADILKKARAPETSEAQAKVNAVNTVAKIDYKIKKDSDLKKDISAGEIINLLSSAMRELTVPLSPLFVSNVRPDQYKFTNHPKAVCHKDVLTSLLNEIAEQSSGGHSVRADAKDNITRGQFAAYLYKLSMMSLPKDLSGKYLGGVSGDRDMDGFIAGILDKAITKGMTDEQKVKAIYDCLIFNFRHEHIDSNFEHYNYASM